MIHLPVWLTDVKGELAALTAALVWAVSSVVYTRVGRHLPPLELNLSKGVIAIALIILTLVVRAVGTGNLASVMPAINPSAFALLTLSGALGIGLGDTAYFAALTSIGPRRALLLEQTLAPPLAAILALSFLQETLSAGAWCGILLTIIGVAWVIGERVNGVNSDPSRLRQGIGWALLAALSQAIGAVLSRAALANTSISPLWSTLIRLGAGVLALLLWVLLRRQRLEISEKLLRSQQVLGVIVLTAFASTYLGIWLQQISLKFAPAGIAQTLGATSPLFVIPLAMWVGESVSLRAIFGVLVALVGVGILFTLR
ncbi:MAG: DMT family transporter [Microcoleus vaginatus WJT46-NPBG5]|jgi:drug/metabolite transporter (DMT)-like permease|nr:DMT family transporter [Microcoleus vaginatus WJT46-NPBG5]